MTMNWERIIDAMEKNLLSQEAVERFSASADQGKLLSNLADNYALRPSTGAVAKLEPMVTASVPAAPIIDELTKQFGALALPIRVITT